MRANDELLGSVEVITRRASIVPGPTECFGLLVEKNVCNYNIGLVTPLTSDMVEENKGLGDQSKRLHGCIKQGLEESLLYANTNRSESL